MSERSELPEGTAVRAVGRFGLPLGIVLGHDRHDCYLIENRRGNRSWWDRERIEEDRAEAQRAPPS